VNSQTQCDFLTLVRLGIGASKEPIISNDNVDWPAIKGLSEQQGLSAVVLDGVNFIVSKRPPQELLLEWIGEVLQAENQYFVQQKASEDIALLYHDNQMRTYVLKGSVVSECYPKPEHRVSSDLDCMLLSEGKAFDAWTLGNDLIIEKEGNVVFDYYKNSTFYLQDIMVENHRYFTPFRGNNRLMTLEKKLQSMIRMDNGEDRFDNTWLYRPPVMVSALFLIEHAYSHFLHEGLSWRHILDWMMFSQKYVKKIDWISFDAMIDEYGFRKFYDSYYRLGLYLMGELSEEDLTSQDKMMMADVWADLDLHETVKGVRGKLALVGNTCRANWKYKYFSEDSMLKALWIQVKGFLFEKNPSLD